MGPPSAGSPGADDMTGRGADDEAGRAGHAGTCARAALFAVLGTVLAALGHHAVAEGPVPWRLTAVLVAAQFSAAWPLSRRGRPPLVTVGFTTVTQGALHLALTRADADVSAGAPGHAMHAGHLAAVGDGHAWHHAGAAMVTVHMAAAAVVGWLLHRADAGMTGALGALRTLAGAAAAALSHVLPRAAADAAGTPHASPLRRTGAFGAAAFSAREDVLEHAVVRRGPPRRDRLRSSPVALSTAPS